MNKWEYKKVVLESKITIENGPDNDGRLCPSLFIFKITDDTEKIFNDLGLDGWELTSSKRYNSNSRPPNLIEYIFKREINLS
ncbi:MAG: hypothetical protein JKY89_00305 [Immundisolibacteraceae bacterium]|nr:hypothetical protein [Immundisolibacteraceae bacterium]